ncbi:MAG: hypothetical protein JSW42_10360 [Chloroflexota bacterium]|nr:MAG: hypothetical protein JSW42_10360 [Chloroflexota bacterium]
MIKNYFMIILAFVLLSACYPGRNDSEKANQAITDFFSELSNGNYGKAVTLYGGSYGILTNFNPDLDANDHVALLKNGCQINGLQCLTIRTITFNELSESGEYIFSVEFNDPAGNLFVLEACCGENPTMVPQFQFEYRVVQGRDGKMRVLDLPVYTP